MSSERSDLSLPAADDEPASPPSRRAALAEVAAVMLRLGFTAFGGPAAHVAMLSEEVVRRRRWVREQEFLDLFGAAGLMPGPTSTELSIHLGMTRAGVAGLWVAGLCFITPAVLITLAFAWAYVEFGRLPAAQALLAGVKPAVLAVILAALLQLGRAAMKGVPLGVLAAGCLGLYLLGVSEVALLLGAGAMGILLAQPWRMAGIAAGLFWLSPGAEQVTRRVLAPGAWDVFLFFLKIGSVLFGSGYVLLAFVRQGLVHDLGWLTDRQLIDAVAVGQFTPGPLFSTATFIGYVIAGWPGAVAASVGIFLPSFLFVWATHPLVRRLRSSRGSAGFLDGVNAGSVALMAGVLFQIGREALTAPLAWLIFAVAALLVFRFRVNSAWIILGGAFAGALGRLGN